MNYLYVPEDVFTVGSGDYQTNSAGKIQKYQYNSETNTSENFLKKHTAIFSNYYNVVTTINSNYYTLELTLKTNDIALRPNETIYEGNNLWMYPLYTEYKYFQTVNFPITRTISIIIDSNSLPIQTIEEDIELTYHMNNNDTTLLIPAGEYTYSSIDQLFTDTNMFYNIGNRTSYNFLNIPYFKYTRMTQLNLGGYFAIRVNQKFMEYYGILHMFYPEDGEFTNRNHSANMAPVYRSLHIPEGYYSANDLINYINNNSTVIYNINGCSSKPLYQFSAKVVDNDIVIYTTDGTEFFINPICHLNTYQETNFASEHRLCAVNEGYEVNTEYICGQTINIQPYFTQTLSNFSATGLPTGLNINADGSISGSPTTSGTYEITVTAYDTNNNECTFTLPEITIIPNPFHYDDYCICTARTSQKVTIYPIIDDGSFSDFTVVEGTLPSGLTINNNGVIRGTIYYSTVGDCVDTTVTIEATSNNGTKVRSTVNIYLNFMYYAFGPREDTSDEGHISDQHYADEFYFFLKYRRGVYETITFDYNNKDLTSVTIDENLKITAVVSSSPQNDSFSFIMTMTDSKGLTMMTIFRGDLYVCPEISYNNVIKKVGETINISPATLIYPSAIGKTLSVSGLPSGCNFNTSTGDITGTATTLGDYTIYVTLDSTLNENHICDKNTATTSFKLSIVEECSLVYENIQTTTPNETYSIYLEPTTKKGELKNLIKVDEGTPQLEFDKTSCIISGEINYNELSNKYYNNTITIRYTDETNNFAYVDVDIFVNFLYVNYNDQRIEVNSPFTIQPTALRGNYTSFDVTGELWNYNSSTGYITGNANTEGVYDFTVKLTDERGQTYTTTFTVEIYSPESLYYADLSDCTSNTTYTVNIEPTIEGTLSNFSVVEGVLPTGLTLNNDGSITGTINYSTVTNKYIDTALRIRGETTTGYYIYATVNIYINFLFIEYNYVPNASRPAHTGSFHKGDTFGMYPVNMRGYFTSETFSGDTNDFTFTFNDDGTFNAIVKDNATTGVHNIKLTIKDDRNFSYTVSFNFTVFAHPTLEISDGYFITNMFNELTPTFTHPSEYSSNTFSATGLPSTLSIDNSTGVISGTPISSGIYNVTVTFTSELNEHHPCEYNTVSKTIVIKVRNEDDLVSLNTVYCCQYYESSQIKINVGEDVTITTVNKPTLPAGIEFVNNSFCYVSRSLGNYPINIEYKYGPQSYTRSFTLKSVDALQNIGGWSVNLGCQFKFNIGFNMSNWSIISAKIYNIDNVWIDTNGYIYGVIDKLTTYYPMIELICRDENGFDHKLIKYITIVCKESNSTPFNYFNVTNRYRFQSKKQINITANKPLSNIFDNFIGNNYQIIPTVADLNLDESECNLSVDNTGKITGNINKVGEYEIIVRRSNINGEYIDAKLYISIHNIKIYSLVKNFFRQIDLTKNFYKIKN